MRHIPLALLMTLAPAPLFAQGDPTRPHIVDISYGGSGCPQQSVGASYTNGRTEFTLMFDKFVASMGTGIPITEYRKNCQVNLTVHVPQGSTAACFTTVFRGYAQLVSDFRAFHFAGYNFDGATEDKESMIIPGPVTQDYVRHHYTILSLSSERDTTAVFTMTPEVRAEDPVAGQMTVDSIDGKIGACEYVDGNGDPRPPFDTTPPIITTTRSVEPNVNGWNNTDVTFSYACEDEDDFATVHPGSSALEPDTLSGSGRAHAACHANRNVSLSYHFADIDKVAPTIGATSPVSGGLYGLNAVVPTAGACSDDNSGIASCTAAAALDTSSLGPKLFTATAVDRAGNVATASVPFLVGGKDECKSGGHALFVVPAFKNQGQCVSTYAGKK